MTRRAIIHQMALDAWAAGAVVLVILLGLEAADRGFVSRFFNIVWLVVFTLAASVAAAATHPGSHEAGHHPTRSAGALLQLAGVGAAAAAWVLLPHDLRTGWRALASGSILIAALTAWPALSKKE